MDIKALDGESKPADSSGENKPSTGESSGTSYQSAWEKWCNAKYGTSKKAPMDIDGQPTLSSTNVENAPISNQTASLK